MSQECAESWIGRTFAQAHYDAQKDESRRAAPLDSDGGEDRQYSGGEDAHAESVLATEFRCYHAAR